MSKYRVKIPSPRRVLPTTKAKKGEYLPRTNHWFTTSRAKQTTKDARFWSKTNSVLKKSCTFAPVFERDKSCVPPHNNNGLLAQLVQSASFTRKRSTVRICNRPLFIWQKTSYGRIPTYVITRQTTYHQQPKIQHNTKQRKRTSLYFLNLSPYICKIFRKFAKCLCFCIAQHIVLIFGTIAIV